MATAEERLSRIEGGYEHLATRADIAELRGEVNSIARELRGEINSNVRELRGEISSVKQELRLHRWILGFMVVVQLATLARVFELIPPG